MIEIKNITKNYDSFSAVNNLSLQIDKGEVVGLLGPNGAGKSTTMKILAGLIIPDEGDVFINGKSIRDYPAYGKRRIGFMPENNPLYKDMLVMEAIEYSLNLSNYPKSNFKQRIDYVVNATGIENVFYKPIGELSKGFKQRVGLAQVLASDPDILILDEPTEGLDPNQRGEIRKLISELGTNKTVIISTHVLQEVESMCNRIVIINKGEVVKDGSKESIRKTNINTSCVYLKIKSNIQPKLNITNSKVTLENSKDKVYSYTINGNNETEIIDSINSQFRDNDWKILELKTETQNLEEIFRSLTVSK